MPTSSRHRAWPLLAASLIAAQAAASEVVVVNPRSQPAQEIVAIPLRGTGHAATCGLRARDDQAWMAVQPWDDDGDGTADTLLAAVTVPANSSRAFALVADPPPAAAPNRLGARHVPERKDDFAFENDHLAFRLYGPALAAEGSRGGIDVWCKRTREPVIDAWYRSGDYHADHGQGLDFYKVGEGLGCGGLGYLTRELFIPSPVYATWTVHAAGPLRLAFTLTYAPVAVGSAAIGERRTITMDQGSAFFHVRSTFTVSGDATGIAPVAGLLLGGEPAVQSAAFATAWWSATGADAVHGAVGQVLIPHGQAHFHSANGHVFARLAESLEQSVSWSVAAAWSKGLDLTTPAALTAAAQEEVARRAQPLRVEVR
jgi:unsaturated rhamnogalacturonyl hydrolase